MTIDLDHLEAKRAAATPGPWRLGFGNEITGPGAGHDVLSAVPGDEPDDLPCLDIREADAAWIVAITNTAPELLAEVRELRMLRDSLADQVVRSHQDGQSARAEVERLREYAGPGPYEPSEADGAKAPTWQELRDLADHNFRLYVTEFDSGRAEIERLHATVQRVRELAQADLKCPCCSGYEDILAAAGDGE